MGFYNVVNPTSMQSGQPEDVSQILANLQAIASILNGGVDNSNIATSPKIDYAKLNLALGIQNGDINDTANIEGHKVNWHKGSSPPGSPQNGDIWILPATGTGPGGYQMYMYNSAEATYKWIFVGGSPHHVHAAGAVGTVGSGVFGESLTIPRAGVYLITASVDINVVINANTIVHWAYSIRNNSAVAYSGVAEYFFQAPTSNQACAISLALNGHVATIPAGEVLRHYMAASGWDTTTFHRAMSILPIKVS